MKCKNDNNIIIIIIITVIIIVITIAITITIVITIIIIITIIIYMNKALSLGKKTQIREIYYMCISMPVSMYIGIICSYNLLFTCCDLCIRIPVCPSCMSMPIDMSLSLSLYHVCILYREHVQQLAQHCGQRRNMGESPTIIRTGLLVVLASAS